PGERRARPATDSWLLATSSKIRRSGLCALTVSGTLVALYPQYQDRRVPARPGRLRCRGALARAMRVRVGCEFRSQAQAPVPMLMLVRARPDATHQPLYESTWTEPFFALREYRDGFENPCWRMVLPAGDSLVRYDAVVDVSGDPDIVVPDAPLVPVE